MHRKYWLKCLALQTNPSRHTVPLTFLSALIRSYAHQTHLHWSIYSSIDYSQLKSAMQPISSKINYHWCIFHPTHSTSHSLHAPFFSLMHPYVPFPVTRTFLVIFGSYFVTKHWIFIPWFVRDCIHKEHKLFGALKRKLVFNWIFCELCSMDLNPDWRWPHGIPTSGMEEWNPNQLNLNCRLCFLDLKPWGSQVEWNPNQLNLNCRFCFLDPKSCRSHVEYINSTSGMEPWLT
jgi:hypothetical protein